MGLFDGFLSFIGDLIGLNASENQSQWERIYNQQEANKNREFQRDERLSSQDWELEMWNKNNEYNSLAQQLSRAKAAGVSPNAILGGDYKPVESSPLSTTPMPGSTASSSSAGAIGSAMIQTYSNIGVRMADIQQKMAQSRLLGTEADYNEQSLSDRLKEIKTTVEAKEATIKEIYSRVGLNELTAEQKQQEIEWFARMKPVELETMNQTLNNLRSDNMLTIERILSEQKNRDVMDNQMRNDNIRTQNDTITTRQGVLESVSRIGVNNAQEDYLVSQTEYQDSLNKYSEEQQKNAIELDDFQIAQNKLKSDFSKATGIPFGTSDFEIKYRIWVAGEWQNYCNTYIDPEKRTHHRVSNEESVLKQIALELLPILQMFNGKGGKTIPKTGFPEMPHTGKHYNGPTDTFF